MALDQLAVLGDANLATCWSRMSRAAGTAQADLGVATLISMDLPIAFFNGAFVHRQGSDPAALVRAAIDFFAAPGLPWLLWVREGVWPAVIEVGRSAGLRDAGGPPAMVLASLAQLPGAPAGLDVEVVHDLEGLAAHAALLQAGFGVPPMVTERLLTPALLASEDFAVVVGRVAGVPVSTAAVCITGKTAGVYNVATPPEQRGRGYGEALTWAAIGEGARRGCTHAVLQASAAGAPVYRRMGFAEVGRYVQLEGPPSS